MTENRVKKFVIVLIKNKEYNVYFIHAEFEYQKVKRKVKID